jgi:hypothetical protein
LLLLLLLLLESIYTEARPSLLSYVQDSLPWRDVTSSASLKDKVPKTYKDALSAGRGPMAAPVSITIVPPKTAINKIQSQLTVGGHSVTSTLLPESSDDGFVTVARKRRVELPGLSTNSSKKLRPAMIGVRSSSSLSVVAKTVSLSH